MREKIRCVVDHLVCLFRGHDWKRGAFFTSCNGALVTLVCSRCGQVQLISTPVQIRDLGMAAAR